MAGAGEEELHILFPRFRVRSSTGFFFPSASASDPPRSLRGCDESNHVSESLFEYCTLARNARWPWVIVAIEGSRGGSLVTKGRIRRDPSLSIRSGTDGRGWRERVRARAIARC